MTTKTLPFITPLFLAIIAFDCGQLAAQTPADSEKGQAQFKRLDKDGDGNVSAAEANGVKKDIRYQETPGVEAVDQSLDIYAPENAQKAPVMIYVHGGSWSKGDKAHVDAAPKFFNKAGWIFVSINYRLLPAGKHPHNIQDVASAVAWVHSHIAEHGGDPSKIFLFGHSAGAHLVALLATDDRRLKEAGKDLSILRGVIPLDTNAYNLPELVKTTGAFYGQIFGSDPDTLRDASPYAHVASGKGIPPILLFHSGTGAEQRSAQGKAFLAKLREAGVNAELVPSLEQTHGDINRQLGTPGDMVTEAAWKFLNASSKESKQ